MREQSQDFRLGKHSHPPLQNLGTVLGHLADSKLVEDGDKVWVVLSVDLPQIDVGKLERLPHPRGKCPIVGSGLADWWQLQKVPHGDHLDATEWSRVVTDVAADIVDKLQHPPG